jgi:nucleoside-diphosphate-sugar epimerase
MPRALVLGTGLVGTFAARALAAAGAAVAAADLEPAGEYYRRHGPPGAAAPARADMLDAAAVGRLLTAHRAEVLVLAAGLVGGACAREPGRAWEVNVEGPRVVAGAALRAGVRRLVFLSSFAVYGRPAGDRVPETHPVCPYTVYGQTKAAAEAVMGAFRDRGLDVRILRPCGAYGPQPWGEGSQSARLIGELLARAADGTDCMLQAPAALADEYVYVKDLGRAAALAALGDTASPEFVFNVGPGARTTVAELCAAVRAAVPAARLAVEPIGGDPGPPRPPLDVSRIRRAFGFEPLYGLVDGLADYLRETRRLP